MSLQASPSRDAKNKRNGKVGLPSQTENPILVGLQQIAHDNIVVSSETDPNCVPYGGTCTGVAIEGPTACQPLCWLTWMQFAKQHPGSLQHRIWAQRCSTVVPRDLGKIPPGQCIACRWPYYYGRRAGSMAGLETKAFAERRSPGP
jgi:hypothetical protein